MGRGFLGWVRGKGIVSHLFPPFPSLKSLDDALHRMKGSIKWIQEGRITGPDSVLQFVIRWDKEGPVLYLDWKVHGQDQLYPPDFLQDWQGGCDD